MKKLIIVTVILAAFLASSIAFAQVYEVKGKKGVFAMGGAVDKYEPYDKAKEDGKIGKLYIILGSEKGKDKPEPKKVYVTDKTKIEKKGGAVATVAQLNPGTAVQVEYKKTSNDELICLTITIE